MRLFAYLTIALLLLTAVSAHADGHDHDDHHDDHYAPKMKYQQGIAYDANSPALLRQQYDPYDSTSIKAHDEGFQKGTWQGSYDKYFGFGFKTQTQQILADPYYPLKARESVYLLNGKPTLVQVKPSHPYEGIAYKIGYALGYYEGYMNTPHALYNSFMQPRHYGYERASTLRYNDNRYHQRYGYRPTSTSAYRSTFPTTYYGTNYAGSRYSYGNSYIGPYNSYSRSSSSPYGYYPTYRQTYRY